ncbi:MAG: hypothetical protein ACLQBA_09525 [Candidatus Binataceae bacterium]
MTRQPIRRPAAAAIGSAAIRSPQPATQAFAPPAPLRRPAYNFASIPLHSPGWPAAPPARNTQFGHQAADTQSVTQLCKYGHPEHAGISCPWNEDERALHKLKTRTVKLGDKHRQASPRKASTKTTPRTEERLTRHLNEHLQGNPSKAQFVGLEGENAAFEINRSTSERQKLKGSRHALAHLGGGDNEGVPLDYFEDQTYSRPGLQSDTEESEVEVPEDEEPEVDVEEKKEEEQAQEEEEEEEKPQLNKKAEARKRRKATKRKKRQELKEKIKSKKSKEAPPEKEEAKPEEED